MDTPALSIRRVCKPGCYDSHGAVVIPDSSWYEFWVVKPTPDGGYYEVLQWSLPAEVMGSLNSDWIVKVNERGWTKDFKWPSGLESRETSHE